MNKRIKQLALLVISASALAFVGCDSGQAQMGPKETNVLGIVKYSQADYSAVPTTSFAVSTDELYSRRNYSGDRVDLLWGLITLKDY
ncbi:hypothetical protein [Coraliomargarita parva]|uniref:hypothetical protein n=1 Tax=Coraliomargarita parva TaxID=3014050 RepID=UPI0022B2C9EC|nr:hypothetical protein [Coraliomargarita parva]